MHRAILPNWLSSIGYRASSRRRGSTRRPGACPPWYSSRCSGASIAPCRTHPPITTSTRLSSGSLTSQVLCALGVSWGLGAVTRIRNSHGFACQADLRESDSDSQALLILCESPCHRRCGAAALPGGFAIRMDSQAKRTRADPTPIRTCPLANPSPQFRGVGFRQALQSPGSFTP